MFDSRIQTAQFVLLGAAIATIAAVGTLIAGPLIVGLFFLVVGNGIAAVGNALYATARGYPAYLGIGLGIGFGVAGSIFLMILPDESDKDPPATSRPPRKRRRKGPGYEVLDD